MNKTLLHGIVLPVALGTLLASSFGAWAEPAPREPVRQDHQDERAATKDKRQAQREEKREARIEARQEARQEVRQEARQQARQVVRQDTRQDRRQERREDRREVRQDRREDRREIRQDRREVRRDIRQDRRAQERYRDDYNRRLRMMQVRNYSPHYYRSGNYRYMRGGQWFRVNYYGADMLRNAIDQGYREGLMAGRADRFDGWRGGYRQSSVWIDASFGFRGRYVSRSEYNYYFRQGFERGYEDGFYGRSRYGRYMNGEAIIIDAVLSTILNLQRY